MLWWRAPARRSPESRSPPTSFAVGFALQRDRTLTGALTACFNSQWLGFACVPAQLSAHPPVTRTAVRNQGARTTQSKPTKPNRPPRAKGFCGETEEEHAATLDLLRATRYDNAFLFAYSR
jgi:hypothetical protein